MCSLLCGRKWKIWGFFFLFGRKFWHAPDHYKPKVFPVVVPEFSRSLYILPSGTLVSYQGLLLLVISYLPGPISMISLM